jgi:hypothetical protein
MPAAAHRLDEATDEPKLSLDRLVADYGAGATLRALYRVLRGHRRARLAEGETAAAAVLRRAANSCLKHADALRDEGV